MIYTPETLIAKAAEVRQLLIKAVAALDELEILDAVTRYALSRPEIEWEPVALAAAALAEKWNRDEAKAKAAPLVAPASLPQDPKAAVAAPGPSGVLLTAPPWGM